VIAGDFNFTPLEGSYNLIRGDCLTPAQVSKIEDSRVVHASVDPTIASEATDAVNEDGDPDRVITNARRCTSLDGLLTISELERLYEQLPNVRSVYPVAYQALGVDRSACFGSAHGLKEHDSGFFEPLVTAYAHYWKATLDYIFLLDSSNGSQVAGVTEAPPPTLLEPGLPLLGISASDHVSLTAEIVNASIM